MKQLLVIGTLCITGLSACNTTAVDEIARRTSDQCYFEKITPAEISTQVEPRLVQSEKRNTTGHLVSPAQYEITRTQTIIKPRSVTKIDAVCPEDMTPEFITSLQRAFQARGLFFSTITGAMDTPTRRAILNFQTVRGVSSETVTKATAQALGLVVIDQ
ncbi:MAG: peptidoglycan-binding protein [Rhodobacteraceae bacterium]|nr:peptidoglycan-binding protein [Paracoccaceae bacterium]